MRMVMVILVCAAGAGPLMVQPGLLPSGWAVLLSWGRRDGLGAQNASDDGDTDDFRSGSA